MIFSVLYLNEIQSHSTTANLLVSKVSNRLFDCHKFKTIQSSNIFSFREELETMLEDAEADVMQVDEQNGHLQFSEHRGKKLSDNLH